MKIKLPVRLQRLHIWTDHSTWVVAFDEGDAKKAYCEYIGDKWDESYDPFDDQVPDTQEFKIHCEKGDWSEFWKRRPLFARADFTDPELPIIIAPAWAWILQNGRGFLSSVEF